MWWFRRCAMGAVAVIYVLASARMAAAQGASEELHGPKAGLCDDACLVEMIEEVWAHVVTSDRAKENFLLRAQAGCTGHCIAQAYNESRVAIAIAGGLIATFLISLVVWGGWMAGMALGSWFVLAKMSLYLASGMVSVGVPLGMMFKEHLSGVGGVQHIMGCTSRCVADVCTHGDCGVRAAGLVFDFGFDSAIVANSPPARQCVPFTEVAQTHTGDVMERAGRAMAATVDPLVLKGENGRICAIAVGGCAAQSSNASQSFRGGCFCDSRGCFVGCPEDNCDCGCRDPDRVPRGACTRWVLYAGEGPRDEGSGHWQIKDTGYGAPDVEWGDMRGWAWLDPEKQRPAFDGLAFGDVCEVDFTR